MKGGNMSTEKISLDSVRSALKDAGDPWEAGVTSLSVLSLEEQIQYLGVTPPPGEESLSEIEKRVESMKVSLQAEAFGAIGAPPSYDLRNVGGKDFVTPIKDQKSCGSCVAFGTVATVESTFRVQRGDANMAADLSEAHLFFCHARARGKNCSTGWWPNEAFDDFKSKGVCDEACYPYNLANTDCSGLCSNWSDRVLRITGYEALTGQPAKIKDWVSTKGPVCACFIVYQDFFNYRSGVYKHVQGAQAGGHCVTIIGYNDTPGYWICKNSWGTGWGENGFFCIAYGECGIDSWQNHGVQGIEETGWVNNRKVIGLWAINEDRNAWVYIEGLGWRKISPDNDNIFLNMLGQLAAAKAAGRLVNVYQVNGVITQLYVF
jgi:C1A family cysteine protease